MRERDSIKPDATWEADEIDPGSHERANIMPEMNWEAGRLDQGRENPSVWRGKISAELLVIKERFGLETEEAARQKLEELKEKSSRFFVKAGERAVVRCIDGRGEDGPLPDNTNLGPQVPGGTPITSVGRRLAIGLEPGATIESDFVEYRSIVEARGLDYISGAHEDETNANHPENTGCGAIDYSLDIFNLMQEYMEADDDLRRYLVHDYAKAVATKYMDDRAFEGTFNNIQVKLKELTGPEYGDYYFQKSREDGSHKFRSSLVKRVKERGKHVGVKTVERLTGTHNEVFLLINTVEGDTFDRDGFAALTDSRAQAFNYDVWVIAQRAVDVFPNDDEKQRTMLVTNIMYAVATAMTLTDGSLELGLRD